jgi:hypothetical protein
MSAVAAYKGEGEDFWSAAIELWLQTLLHVAALRRGSMELVHYWALSKNPESFLGALTGAGGEAERWGTLIRDLMTSAATKTTDTIRYMTAANLGFMLDPVLREAVTPGPGMFSPAEFVRDGGTLYLIAESRDERPSPVAGLFAALVTEIYHQAALAAATMPGGRLDPRRWVAVMSAGPVTRCAESNRLAVSSGSGGGLARKAMSWSAESRYVFRVFANLPSARSASVQELRRSSRTARASASAGAVGVLSAMPAEYRRRHSYLLSERCSSRRQPIRPAFWLVKAVLRARQDSNPRPAA